MANFATMLKQLRTEKGLTQPELSQLLGISRSAISMYEQGKREPDLATLELIARFFEVDLNLLTGTDLGPDDFTYALYNESRGLSEENRKKLLEMARFFKNTQTEE